MNETGNEGAIFAKGQQASPDYFTGNAWISILVQQDETATYTIGNVVFEPSARNNWHTHPAGQILLVTEGNGYYQERGKVAKPISKGDVIIIPSAIEHWHGASPTSSLVHIVITNMDKDGPVNWLEPVTDEDYKNCLVEKK